MYEEAINILNEIDRQGYIAYIIGGFPRNLILNKKSTDIDICTSAPPDVLKQWYEVIEDNSKFGSLKIKKDKFIFEITTFRIDLEYKGRYPKIRYTNDILEDLKRRDFTINTLCIDKDGNLIDFLNAKKDIDLKIIRCIGNIDKKLQEDPLRILRAIRFQTELDFKLDIDLLNKIKQYSYLVQNLNINQINKEIYKMDSEGIKNLKKLGIWRYINARKNNEFN